LALQDDPLEKGDTKNCGAIMRNEKDKDLPFVFWEYTFHPETGEAFLTGGNTTKCQESRWKVVWAEAVGFKEDDATVVTDDSDQTSKEEPVVSVPVKAPNKTYPDDPLQPQEPDVRHTSMPTRNKSSSCICAQSNILVGLIGIVLTVASISVTLALDLVGLLMYFLACYFHRLCRLTSGVYLQCMVIWPLFLPLAMALFFADTLIFFLSVFIAEILAMVIWASCMILGGCSVATSWHQYIRKMCHLTRWAARDWYEDLEERKDKFPRRGYPKLVPSNKDSLPSFIPKMDLTAAGAPTSNAPPKDSQAAYQAAHDQAFQGLL